VGTLPIAEVVAHLLDRVARKVNEDE